MSYVPVKHLPMVAVFVLLLIAAYLLLHTKTATSHELKNSMIVAFGDSLVQGVGATPSNDFVSLLAAKIHRPIQNMGVSGETTATALALVPKVLATDPGLVIVLLGGNDALQRVPIDETFKNLRSIVDNLQKSGATVVLLGVRGGLLSDPYRARFDSLAKETGAVYVPNVLDGIFGNSDRMYDQVHPNNAGYKIIADRVYEVVQPFFK